MYPTGLHACLTAIKPFRTLPWIMYFATRPGADMDETLSVLSCSLLEHWLPHGHTFEMRPQDTLLNCSSGYMKWSTHSLGFLLEASSFTSGVAAPPVAAKGKNAALLGAIPLYYCRSFAFYF